MNKLIYRRQFLLTRKPFVELEGWSIIKFAEFNLSIHPDLPIVEKQKTGITIVLLGDIFNPTMPQLNNKEVIQNIISKINGFSDLLGELKTHTGRYAIFYNDQKNSNIINDPLVLREVYYCKTDNLVVCGSQPNLLAHFSNPVIKESSDPDLIDFKQNHLPHVRGGRLWVGDGSCYENIKHLMPNHYLDLHQMQVVRYWPNKKINQISRDVAVTKACDYLKGAIKAITTRYSVMMAITSGKDSRSLLAASKDVKNNIYFFINKEKHLTEKSADIRIPKSIANKLNIPFHIHDVNGLVDKDFKKIFLDNTYMSTDRILTTIYNVYFKNHQDKVNLLGVGEIGREYYGKAPRDLDGYYLARCLKYKKSRYATSQCDLWLQEAKPAANANNIDIMKLFLWEQLLGNWGTVGNSESDIAIEEFDPYDSHYIYEIMLSIEMKNGDIFKDLYKEMWPELVAFPINPPENLKERIEIYLQWLKIYHFIKLCRFKYDRWKYYKTNHRAL